MFSGWFKGGGVGGVAVPGIGGQAGIEPGEAVAGATSLTLGSGSFVLHSGSFNRKPCSVFICSEQVSSTYSSVLNNRPLLIIIRAELSRRSGLNNYPTKEYVEFGAY